jgi:LruC domain-containing protein
MVALDTPSLRAATPRRSELSPWFFALIALAGGLASGAPQRAAADGWFVDTDGDGATDDVDPFPCHWRRAGATYVPAENQYGTLAHEDNWPARGDLDFNDAVVAFNVVFFHDISGRTTGARLTVIPRAVGAKTRSGLAVRLPFASEVIAGVSATRGGEARNVPYRADAAGVVLTLSDDLRAEFGPGDTFVNTVSRDASDAPMTVVDVDLSTALDVDVWNGEVDFFFFRTADPSHEVHGPRFQGTTRMNTALFGTADDASNGDLRFIDETGMPFVFVLPAATVWPTERTSIYTIFEAFARFASSGGEVGADFYLQGQQGSSLSVAFAELDAVPGAAAQCSMPACDDGVRNGTESDLDCGGGCGPCDVGRACASDADCATGQCDTGTCVSGAPQVLQPGSAAVVRRGEYAARCARWQGDACLDAFLEYGGRWYGIDDHGGGDTSILNLFCFTATGRQGHTRFDTNGTQRANGSSFTPNARIFAYPFCWTWGSGTQGCQPNEIIAAASSYTYAVTDDGSGPWSAAASAAECSAW